MKSKRDHPSLKYADSCTVILIKASTVNTTLNATFTLSIAVLIATGSSYHEQAMTIVLSTIESDIVFSKTGEIVT